MLYSTLRPTIVREEPDISPGKTVLYADIWRHIVGFLPAYKRAGCKSIHNISKDFSLQGWFKNTKKPSIQDVVDSCKSPEDALNILSDEALCQQLSFSEFLRVAGTNPILTQILLKEIPAIDLQDLEALARNNLTSANLVLKSRVLSITQKAYIVRHHQTLAQEFVNNTGDAELVGIVNQFRYQDLKEILKCIVRTGKFHLLEIHTLSAQTRKYYGSNLAAMLLSDPKSPLNKEMHLDDFESLKQKSTLRHTFLFLMSMQGKGHEILDNPSLVSQLEGRDLLVLGKHDQAVAARIFNDDILKSKLISVDKDSRWVDGYLEEEIPSLIDNEADNDYLFSATSLQLTNKQAHTILNDARFKDRINEYFLYQLCEKHPELEREILTGEFRKLLPQISKYFNAVPCKFAGEHFRFNSENLQKLSKTELQMYTARYASVACAVLKDPKLREKVFPKSSKYKTISNLPKMANSPYVAVNKLLLSIINDKIKQGLVLNDVDENTLNKMRYRINIQNILVCHAKVLWQMRHISGLEIILEDLMKIFELPVDARLVAFNKLATVFIKTQKPLILDTKQTDHEIELLLNSSSKNIKMLLDSSLSVDQCVYLMVQFKVIVEDRINQSTLEISHPSKRCADETVSKENKKYKRK